MLRINDIVRISSAYSIKFKGRVGKIKDIRPEDRLYLKIQFSEDGMLYGFTAEEVSKIDLKEEF